MKRTINDYFSKWFTNGTIITKNIGNTGYFVRYGYFNNDYVFLTKKQLIATLRYYETNERRIKLLTLQILND